MDLRKFATTVLSTKTVAFLKLSVAIIGVIHAVKEVKDVYKVRD